MMTILYHLAFFLFALGYLPVFFLKKKSVDHFRERFGVLPKNSVPAGKRVLWLHAVSLGEALASVPLIQEVRKAFPDIHFSFSTTTRTGRTVLEGVRKKDELLFYFPLDLGWVVRRVIRTVRPVLFATMETEIWPNLLLTLKKENVRVALLNGRISDKSFRWYDRVRWALSAPLQSVDRFGMQSTEDAERIQKLGADPSKVRILGNMKFDLVTPRSGDVSVSGIRDRLGLGEEEKLWIAGSTHPGEETLLLESYIALSKEFPTLRLLIAPRHPERKGEVAALVHSFKKEIHSEVLILDTVGELRSLYAAADFVFIGGSLVPKGGQNLLEPAFFGKPILFGPHMENFKDITRLFLNEKAAVQVRGREDLIAASRRFLSDVSLGKDYGEKAKRVLFENQGVVGRYLVLLKELL